MLADQARAEELAEWLRGSGRFVTVARGLLYGAAREVALKVAETTSFLTAAFSAADLRHGPIAIASSGPPVLGFVHPGPASADVLEVVGELRQRGASTRLAGARTRQRHRVARLRSGDSRLSWRSCGVNNLRSRSPASSGATRTRARADEGHSYLTRAMDQVRQPCQGRPGRLGHHECQRRQPCPRCHRATLEWA